MITTNEKAKEKLCPRKINMDPKLILELPNELYNGYNCEGDHCMAWVEVSVDPDFNEFGCCGLANEDNSNYLPLPPRSTIKNGFSIVKRPE